MPNEHADGFDINRHDEPSAAEAAIAAIAGMGFRRHLGDREV